MTTAGAGDQTLGRIMFYRQLEPLSVEKHRKLGVSQVQNPFSFLADTHLVPLTVDEFGLAAVCYPIIFDTQTKTPLAVMGLRPGMNVFLAADGSLRRRCCAVAGRDRRPAPARAAARPVWVRAGRGITRWQRIARLGPARLKGLSVRA